MKQTNTRAMVETAFVSTIVVMLTIVGSTVPFLSLLATLVAPSGIALIGIRWGIRARFPFSRSINGNGYHLGIFLAKYLPR